jgi:hypothetical protein
MSKWKRVLKAIVDYGPGIVKTIFAVKGAKKAEK